MTTLRTFAIASRFTVSGAVLLALTLVAMACTPSGQQALGSDARRFPGTQPADAAAPAARQRFLEMFARAYFPGRTGQLLIVPREGDFITRPDPDVAYMHGSPWAYDVSIPLMFVGPAVRKGVYSVPAVQQDVASTLAAALGVQMPPTATGRILPVFRRGFVRPRAIMLIVLDGMRRDYFDRYKESMPTLDALRQRGAWFNRARVNFLPTNTAVGHSTISTGADPRVHVMGVLARAIEPLARLPLDRSKTWQIIPSRVEFRAFKCHAITSSRMAIVFRASPRSFALRRLPPIHELRIGDVPRVGHWLDCRKRLSRSTSVTSHRERDIGVCVTMSLRAQIGAKQSPTR
jgi:hypothetical protein